MHQKAVEALPGLNKLVEQLQSSPDLMETLAPFSSLAAPDTRIKFELPDKGAKQNSTVVTIQPNGGQIVLQPTSNMMTNSPFELEASERLHDLDAAAARKEAVEVTDTIELIGMTREMDDGQLLEFLTTEERAVTLVTKLLDINDKDRVAYKTLQRTHTAFLKRYQEAQAEFSFELLETVLQFGKNRALHAQVEQLTLELELEREAKLRFKEAAKGHEELSASRRAALSSACAQERMRGELQAKLDLSIEAVAISPAAQEVAAGHRRAYFWQGFLRGAKWNNKLQPLRRLVGEPSSAASATTSRPPALPSDKLTRAEAFHEAVVLLSSPPSEEIKLKLRERAAQL
ncbi:hypothetical protein J4E80_004731 [Alternaria sp. BMP 0032]|nr:hypothetical protein J4E80_004731 [Alternaria sp. BMP 0032]